jgi:signal transduction protein with GAF and PtsI domain
MNPYFILGAVVAVVGAYATGHWQGDSAGQAKVHQAWDKERAAQMAQHAKDQELARQKEQQLQSGADNLRRERDHEVRNLNAKLLGITNGLRDRPDRPTTDKSGVSETTSSGSTGKGCDGSELYRSNAEFLIREAARAEELRASLRQCIAQYQSLVN